MNEKLGIGLGILFIILAIILFFVTPGFPFDELLSLIIAIIIMFKALVK